MPDPRICHPAQVPEELQTGNQSVPWNSSGDGARCAVSGTGQGHLGGVALVLYSNRGKEASVVCNIDRVACPIPTYLY